MGTNSPVADGKELNQKKEGSKYKNPDYIRVTEALAHINDPSDKRLERWKINNHKTYDEYEEGLRLSAERGSWIDDAIKKLVRKEPIGEVPEDKKGYIAAFFKWQSEVRFELGGYDEEVSDDVDKYVGTLDLWGKLDKTCVIDIKTGKPTRDKEGSPKYEVFDKQFWQTAAYRNAKGVDENYVLRLFNDGNYRFVKDPNYENSLAIFRSGLNTARLIKQRRNGK